MNNGASVRLSRTGAGRVIAAIDTWLDEPDTIEAGRAAVSGRLSRRVVELVDGALAAGNSYRDGVMIQLAWGLEQSGFDHTQKGDGARSAAGAIAKALAARHIPAVKDAYQNIGKNTANLARGNVPAFDDLLRWMNDASEAERQSALDLVTATAASTARPVLPMPEVARANLTFVNVVSALDELLAVPSGGAHEQFAVAAFLEALIDEFGLAGVGALSVRTKNINASDASAGTAADVQVMRGNRVEEAFEVSHPAGGKRSTRQSLLLRTRI